MQVVRIELEGGQRIVGVKWPIELAGEVGTCLDAAAANKVAAAPHSALSTPSRVSDPPPGTYYVRRRRGWVARPTPPLVA